MSTGSAVAVYFIIWWVTLFAVLPFGVRSQIESGVVSPGSDPGAPAVTRFARIFLINSTLAAIGFAFFYFVLLPELP
jgi:predicted secreted protein